MDYKIITLVRNKQNKEKNLMSYMNDNPFFADAVVSF